MNIVNKLEDYKVVLEKEQRFNEIFIINNTIDEINNLYKNTQQLCDDIESLLDRSDIPTDVMMKLGNALFYLSKRKK